MTVPSHACVLPPDATPVTLLWRIHYRRHHHAHILLPSPVSCRVTALRVYDLPAVRTPAIVARCCNTRTRSRYQPRLYFITVMIVWSRAALHLVPLPSGSSHTSPVTLFSFTPCLRTQLSLPPSFRSSFNAHFNTPAARGAEHVFTLHYKLLPVVNWFLQPTLRCLRLHAAPPVCRICYAVTLLLPRLLPYRDRCGFALVTSCNLRSAIGVHDWVLAWFVCRPTLHLQFSTLVVLF